VKKITLLFIIGFTLPQLVSAQLQANQSIVSASGAYSSANFRISWSIGEIFTESFSNSTVKINHGLNEAGAIYVITAIEDAEAIEGYHLYPNPFSTDLILEVPQNLKDPIINMTDLTGKALLPEIVKERNRYTVTPNDIAQGTYIVSIQNENKIVSFKIIKK
jgi:Secretion system C-terminal sorting domain